MFAELGVDVKGAGRWHQGGPRAVWGSREGAGFGIFWGVGGHGSSVGVR